MWGRPSPPFPFQSQLQTLRDLKRKPVQGDSLPPATQRSTTPLPVPRLASLLHGLSVAVSLALLPWLAATAAGLAAVASVPGTAGLASLAAVLQCGTGMGPLWPIILQEQRLKHRQVLLTAPDLSPQ